MKSYEIKKNILYNEFIIQLQLFFNELGEVFDFNFLVDINTYQKFITELGLYFLLKGFIFIVQDTFNKDVYRNSPGGKS